ncbi:hypothetical protein PINS_up003042 [Pythium insidiosum]|nr:hypothetical protein PINS_up003042 [Pythium insidiosum]
MRTWRPLAAVATVAVVASLTSASHYNRNGDDTKDAGWASYVQQEIARSSAMIERLFQESMGSPVMRVIVVDDEEPQREDAPLTDSERSLACRVALRRLEEQRALQKEQQRWTSRLRASYHNAVRLVSFRFHDETTCQDLERTELVQVCERVLGLADDVNALWEEGKSDEEVCEALQSPSEALENELVGSPLSCKLCQRFVEMVANAVKQDLAQVEQVREILGDMCDSMSEDSMCHVFLKRYDDVVEWVKRGTDPQYVCSQLAMCAKNAVPLAGAKKSIVAASPVEGAPAITSSVDKKRPQECFYCLNIAGAITFVSKNSPDQLQSLRTILDGVCKAAPEVSKCNDTLKNFDKIVDWAKQGKRPYQICKALDKCTKHPHTKDDFLAAISDEHVFEKVPALLLSLKNANTELTAASDDKTCFYCDYFTTMIEVVLQEAPQNVDEIREYADMICGMLGDDNKCHDYVNKLDYIVDSLKKGKKPRQICKDLKLCPASKTAEAKPEAERSAHGIDIEAFNKTMHRAVGASIDGCFFCTQVTSVLKVAMAENPDKLDEIRNIADLVCNMLPADNKCHPFIHDMDQIIDSIRNGEDPAAICHDLKYCPSKKAFELAPVTRKAVSSKKSNQCAYCDGIVTVLEYALRQKPDELHEMREAAGIVCELLPEDDQCHKDLKMFDTAVQMLKNGKQPHEVCSALKFCTTASDSKPLSFQDMKVLDSSVAPTKCGKCKQNALLVAALAMRPADLTTLRRELDTVCRLVPDSDECALLLEHRDMIVDSLKKGDDIDTICERVHACPKSATPAVEKSMTMGCLFCEYTAEVLTRAAMDDGELRLAKKALETMCFILPPNARCDMLTSKFDELVHLVKQGKSPNEACHSVAMCDGVFADEPSAPMKAEDSVIAVQ